MFSSLWRLLLWSYCAAGITIESDEIGGSIESDEIGGSIESDEIEGSIPEASRPPFGGRQERKEEFLRGEDRSDDEDDDVDFDDPKYQQKPDWMQDAVWQAINNQGMKSAYTSTSIRFKAGTYSFYSC